MGNPKKEIKVYMFEALWRKPGWGRNIKSKAERKGTHKRPLLFIL